MFMLYVFCRCQSSSVRNHLKLHLDSILRMDTYFHYDLWTMLFQKHIDKVVMTKDLLPGESYLIINDNIYYILKTQASRVTNIRIMFEFYLPHVSVSAETRSEDEIRFRFRLKISFSLLHYYLITKSAL